MLVYFGLRKSRYLRYKLVFDEHFVAINAELPRFTPREEYYDRDREKEAKMARLVDIYGGERLSVLRLGTARLCVQVSSGVAFRDETMTFGLLLLNDAMNRVSCQRVGICSWILEPSVLWDTATGLAAPRKPNWEPFSGNIG